MTDRAKEAEYYIYLIRDNIDTMESVKEITTIEKALKAMESYIPLLAEILATCHERSRKDLAEEIILLTENENERQKVIKAL